MPDVVEEKEEEMDSWVTIASLIPVFHLIAGSQVRVGNRGDFP